MEVLDSKDAYKFVLCAGGPLNGFRIFGPFETVGEAESWGAEHDFEHRWVLKIWPACDAYELAPELRQVAASQHERKVA